MSVQICAVELTHTLIGYSKKAGIPGIKNTYILLMKSINQILNTRRANTCRQHIAVVTLHGKLKIVVAHLLKIIDKVSYRTFSKLTLLIGDASNLSLVDVNGRRIKLGTASDIEVFLIFPLEARIGRHHALAVITLI